MCNFKFCKNRRKCVLAGVSPCQGFDPKVESVSDQTSKESNRIRSLNLSYDGFLEPDALFDVLAEIDQHGAPAVQMA